MVPIENLWQEHKDRLRSYINRRVRDEHATDDILHEVFIKLHKNLHTVKSSGSVSAWLYRVAANAIADYYRTHKPVEALPDELPAPEQERDYVAELASCLQPMIEDLPDTYRTALTLSEIEGLKQKEVAARLGISLSGAKSRVQRGREKLRESILRCCAVETGKHGIVGYEVRGKGCGGCDPE
jgi:RNA polymerase sigma-70 factor, ECF subfamily